MSSGKVLEVVTSLFRSIKNGETIEDGERDGVRWTVVDNILSISVGNNEHSVWISRVRNKKISALAVVTLLHIEDEIAVEETEEEAPAPVAEVVEAPAPAPVAEIPAEVREKQVRVYTRKPGPKGKRSEGTDYDICKSVLETELRGVRLVSREALQSACNARTGRIFAIQGTHWSGSESFTYKNGTVRGPILLHSGLGPKSGVYINPFFSETPVTVETEETISV